VLCERACERTSERSSAANAVDERQRGELVSENDPDPQEPGVGFGKSVLGGREVPDAGDPTEGGKRGEIGDAPSITSDEPDPGGQGYPVGGGDVSEESNAVPVADPGPDA
jgi:hypothetical protein